MTPVPRIGIDAMGGDYGPAAAVDGAIRALRAEPERYRITLVGDEAEIRHEIRRHHADGLMLEIRHAAERIDMSEKAAAAARRTGSSLGVATQLHKQGELDAVFSAGNTGAVVATALIGLGRLEAVSRPAIAAYLPNTAGGCVVLDVGANAECKPQYLLQFAHMGSVYARYVLGRENPRVGLLSIGEERSKGNDLVREAHEMLRRATHLNFIGNVEGRDIFKGTADVVVTDGFTGNVVLKTAESVAGLLVAKLRDEVRRDPLALAGALLMKPALGRLRKQLDWEEYGAAPLLGVNGVCFIGHGRSRGKAIHSAVRTVARFVEQRVNEHIRQEIEADYGSAA